MVWLIGMSVPGGDDIQAKAQEKLALLKALSQSRGGIVCEVKTAVRCSHISSALLEAPHDMI